MKTTPHLLVIDDENHICESCDRLFSNAGYKVDTNISATNGFRQALSNPYDAIILDLNLVESDGLKLLYGIRKRKPDVPVIIITGYPSEDSRRKSNTLGITDYITKPFGPSEILESVQKVVSGNKFPAESGTEQAVDEIREVNYHFHRSSWFYRMSNGLVRVGAYIPAMSNNYLKSIRLPEPESFIFRGLPIAEVTLGNGMKQAIPSSVSGKVLVTNGDLKYHFYNLEKNIHSKTWIALVEPLDLQQDLEASETRKILFFTKREIEENDFLMRFKKKGYITRIGENLKEVLRILSEGTFRVLFLDAAKFGESGPKYVKKINRAFPDVKIIVFNEPDINSEKQYRKYNIFYYGVNPISNNEIVDLLHCAFQNKRVIPLKNPKVSDFLPDTINKISITNRHGMKVTLFACDHVLRNNYGLGYLLTKELLDKLFPINVHLTRFPKSIEDLASSQNIEKEKEISDRIIILQATDQNMIPGSILRDMVEYKNNKSGLNELINLRIQPGKESARSMEFDADTTLALKDLIMNEMVHG